MTTLCWGAEPHNTLAWGGTVSSGTLTGAIQVQVLVFNPQVQMEANTLLLHVRGLRPRGRPRVSDASHLKFFYCGMVPRCLPD